MNLIQKHARTAVALFFLALLLTGLFTIGGYGRAWDDLSEMKILRMALKEYDSLLPGDTSYSAYLQGLDLPRISESVERDHGICMYYPLFWAFADNHFSPNELTLIWRCHTWCIFTLGLFALYSIARRMGLSRLMSCAAVLILFLSPRFFAEGHYNNKDIPLMALTLVLLWQTARLMEKPIWQRGLCFSLAAGLCASTRVIGIAFCGLFGLVLVLHLYFTRRLNRSVIGVGILVLIVSIFFYMLFTPSFLANPLAFVEYVLKNAVGFSRWHGSILYFGDIISCASSKPPRSYLPVFIAITTPIWALLLLGVGVFFLVRSLWVSRRTFPTDPSAMISLSALLGWILPLLAMVAIRALVYNGWRHAYFLYGFMVLCMAWGLNELWKKFQRRLWQKRLLAATMAVCMASSAVGIALNHPYQYAYYNALIPSEGRFAQFEPDWWNLSCANALGKLLAQTEGPITVGASDPYTQSGLSLGVYHIPTDGRIEVIPYGDSRTPQYVLANLGYASIAQFEPTPDMTPVVTISAYGSPIAIIYQTEGVDAT